MSAHYPNKMKQWRREAEGHNLDASEKAGCRVRHQGRRNKPFAFQGKAVGLSEWQIAFLSRAFEVAAP